MSKVKLTNPKVLAFERKLDPSDALLFSGSWDDRATATTWPAIEVREKSVRGTISNRFKTKAPDPTKIDADIRNANPQTVDIAALDSQHDTLQMRFTLRVLPGTGTPSACSDADYQVKLVETVNTYVEANKFTELAKRYAANLSSGRFLWRNRIGAEQIEVSVVRLVKGKVAATYRFNGLEFSLRNFDHSTPELEQLSQVIADGLAGEEHVLLEVTAFARMGAGQEVFPSQEMILERSSGDKSKTLYSVKGVAALHSQKVGNAIRTIDSWYPVEAETLSLGPIAIEPYGSVTTRGTALRKPQTKMSFYNLLDNWLLKDDAPALEQQHYVMAVLIRGGVFSDAG